MIDWRVYNGNVVDVIECLDSESVNCVVTSPPYWGLRDYGREGQLGLETTPDEYVRKITEVFREVRRVLRKDGTLWLNLGDSYASGGQNSGSTPESLTGKQRSNAGCRYERRVAPEGLKPKDLVGVPWKVAFALQADGWYLRQDIIWHKPNPMPESVKDRCTKAHEYIFLLSKSERYYFDWRQMQELAVASSEHDATGRTKQRGLRDSFKRSSSKRSVAHVNQSVGTHRADRKENEYSLTTRNRRDVWTVATRPYKEAHFATFPPALIEPCILAGCPVGGIVLDPFVGSGTTLEVAYRWARNSIGIELNSDYVSMIDRRMQKAVSESLI